MSDSEWPAYEDAQPMTLAQQLDAAESGEEFARALTNFMFAVDLTRHRGPGANRESE